MVLGSSASPRSPASSAELRSGRTFNRQHGPRSRPPCEYPSTSSSCTFGSGIESRDQVTVSGLAGGLTEWSDPPFGPAAFPPRAHPAVWGLPGPARSGAWAGCQGRVAVGVGLEESQERACRAGAEPAESRGRQVSSCLAQPGSDAVGCGRPAAAGNQLRYPPLIRRRLVPLTVNPAASPTVAAERRADAGFDRDSAATDRDRLWCYREAYSALSKFAYMSMDLGVTKGRNWL